MQTLYVSGDQPDQYYAQIDANTGVSWYLNDRLNSVRDLMTNAGQLPDTLAYNAYGELISQTDAALTPLIGYTGFLYQASVGMDKAEFRWYNPQTGQWQTEDPDLLGPGPNPREYVDDAPTNATDSTGLFDPEDAWDELTRDDRENWIRLRLRGWSIVTEATSSGTPMGSRRNFTTHDDIEVNVNEDYFEGLQKQGYDVYWVRGQWGVDWTRKLIWIDAWRDSSAADFAKQAFAKALEKYAGPIEAQAPRPGSNLGQSMDQTIPGWRAGRQVSMGQANTLANTAVQFNAAGPSFASPSRFAAAGSIMRSAPQVEMNAPLLGGSAQKQAYIKALQGEGAQNYQFIRAAGQQYSERSCVPAVLQQRLGSSPEMARMIELADRQGGYTLKQARNFLVSNKIMPAADLNYVDSISIENLATRATQANGKTTAVLNVRGTSGPHAVGIQGYVPIEGVPGGGAFRIHDPLTGTEYWLSARSLQQRMTGPNLGGALLIK